MANSLWVPLDYKIAVGTPSSIASDRFDACNYLRVFVRIAGYAGGAIAQLRFNGDTGTTAYSYRVSNNFAVATTAVAGAAAGIKVAQTSTVNPRGLLTFDIINITGRPHGIVWSGSDQSELAATAPEIVIGAGLWATTTQITQITLEAGGSTFIAGTDMAIFGMQGLG